MHTNPLRYRWLFLTAAFLGTAPIVGTLTSAQTSPAPTFRLFFIGHEIGRETDVRSTDGRRLDVGGRPLCGP